MDPQSYVGLLRRWWWVLLLGCGIGAVAASLMSHFQAPVYQATTRVLVMRAPEGPLLDLGYMSDSQLADTYAWLLQTSDVLDKTGEELGYPVLPDQVMVRLVENTQLIDVIVEADDASSAALIANTLLSTFIEENESLLAGRFASLEESLLAQVTQVRAQIDSLQRDAAQASDETIQEQLAQVEEQLAALRQEAENFQREIIDLEEEADFQPLVPGFYSSRPTPSVDQRSEMAITRDRLAEVQALLALYQEVQVSLSVPAGAPGGAVAHSDQLQATLALYQQIYANLLGNYESVRLARLRNTPNVVQVEAAREPVRPVRPRPLRNALIGAMAGLLLAGCVAFLVEYADSTIQGPEETTRRLGLPVLGYIPDLGSSRAAADRGVHLLLDHQAPALDCYLFLRTNLEFAAADKPFRTILISSPGPDEGKTTVAVNLGAAIAQGGKRVVLVDADLRRPALHRPFGLRVSPGLTDWLRAPTHEPPPVVETPRDRLAVLPAGSEVHEPLDYLSSPRMAAVLSSLREQADVVIVDSPPVSLPDPSVLVANADAVLLVLRPGHTRVDAAQASVEQLTRAGGKLVGVVLNRIPRDRLEYFGGYMPYARRYYLRRQPDAGSATIEPDPGPDQAHGD